MIGLLQRSAPERHDLVANELVDGPILLLDRSRHRFEIHVERRHHIRRLKPLSCCGESSQVGEEHRQLSRLALQRPNRILGLRNDLLDHMRSRIAAEYPSDVAALTHLAEVPAPTPSFGGSGARRKRDFLLLHRRTAKDYPETDLVDQPAADSDRDGLRAVGGSELLVEVAEISLHRRLRKTQPDRDLLVGQPLGQERDHFELSGRQSR